MVTLTEALDELVSEHDRVGSPLRSRLGPGRPRPDVETALAGIGLSAPDQVVELCGWREILDDPSDQSRVAWFWPAAPYRLDEAVEVYRRSVEIGGVPPQEADGLDGQASAASTYTGFWRTDWLPFLYGSPEVYAVECGSEAGSTTLAVWRVNWHPDPGFETVQVADDLTSFVARIVELFRIGAYAWNNELQSIEPVDRVFEQMGLGATARPWP